MKHQPKPLIYFVILVHLLFFILEALFWMRPEVHNILLLQLNNPIDLDYPAQALVLRNLFINQGFYNLFLVIAGVFGLRSIGKGNLTIGYILIGYMCFSAVGAGIVLALSTQAYVLAVCQAVPAAVVLYRMLGKQIQRSVCSAHD